MNVIKIINITGTREASFPVGDHEISNYVDNYPGYDEYGYVVTKTRPISASFILNKGYGVTFYRDPLFRGPKRSFYAGENDLNRGFVGPNVGDRTIGGMTFETSPHAMINNIRSIKVIALPTKLFCANPDISSRDLCESIWGPDVIKSAGSQYRNGPIINEMDWGNNKDNDYVPTAIPTKSPIKAPTQPNNISTKMIITILLIIIASIGGYYVLSDNTEEYNRRPEFRQYNRNYMV